MNTKKLLGIVVAAALVFGFAGQSFAYFEDLKLIRTIYNPSSVNQIEVGSDLGANAWNTPGVYGSINTSTFVDAASTLRVSYYANSGSFANGNDQYWITAYNTDNTYTVKGRQGTNLTGPENTIQEYYGSFGTADAVGTTPNAGSYFTNEDVNSVGSMFGAMGSGNLHATVSLAALSTVGYVDSKLYYFDYNNSTSNKLGTLVATIRTFLTNDGTTVALNGTQIATQINPVPIPPSVFLLGSSLLGLIGIRRFRRTNA